MRNAVKVLTALITLAAVGACKKQEAQTDQNVAIDINSVSPNDIEELPADESSTTPSNQLANGYDDSDLNETDVAGNSY
jgi:hypothetical protein